MPGAIRTQTTTELEPGATGTWRTVDIMRRLTLEAADHPDVLAQARALPDPASLRAWVARTIRYTPDDPEELLISPGVMAATIAGAGTARGDCDDIAMYASALALARGWHVRWVLLGFAPRGAYDHIYAEIEGREVDTTRDVQRLPDRPPARTHTVPIDGSASVHQRTHGLGFFPGFETLLQAGLTWISGRGGDGSYASWVERYGIPTVNTGSPCPGQPATSTVIRGLAASPRGVKETLVRALAAANDGYAPSVGELPAADTAPLWIRAAWGGGDCVATSSAGETAKEALLLITRNASGGSGGDFPSTTNGGDGASAWDQLQAGLQAALAEAWGVATREAARAIYDSLPPAERQRIEAQILRDRAGSVASTAGGAAPWIIAGLAVAALVASRRR